MYVIYFFLTVSWCHCVIQPGEFKGLNHIIPSIEAWALLTCFCGYSSCLILNGLFIAYGLAVARALVHSIGYAVATFTVTSLDCYTSYLIDSWIHKYSSLGKTSPHQAHLQ